MWATIGVVPQMNGIWTDVAFFQMYRQQWLLLRPATETLLPSVHVELSRQEDMDDGFVLLRRFLSALTWSTGWGFAEALRLFGSARNAVSRGRRPFEAPSAPIQRTHWVPEPADVRAQLALALYREGLNAESPAYRFLSFYKILEVVASGRSRITQLASKHVPAALGAARLRLESTTFEELEALPSDLPNGNPMAISERLYEDGRCAIAHAHAAPVVDPDVSPDTDRLSREVPLVRALAEEIIVNELGVPRSAPSGWSPQLKSAS
jgi:hypothetical protein